MRLSLLALAFGACALAGFASQVFAEDRDSAAQTLAERAVIVDTHIDAPTGLMKRWADLGVPQPDREFDYPRARAGGLDVAFMSIYTSSGQDADGSAWNIANRMIDAIEALAQRHPDKFALLRSPHEIDAKLIYRAQSLSAGKDAGGPMVEHRRVLLPLGMENGAPIGGDLANLRFFFDRGIRYITLAHSANNRIADSSYAAEKQWKGLSPFGREVVAEMNRLGMMVDVSHLSDDAVAQSVALSRAPVVATHSALRHFTPGFERNLSDELAKAIAAKGGVVMIPFGNPFVDPASAAQTQAYFRAANEFNARNAALAAAAKPTESFETFDANWDAAHPPLKTDIERVLEQIDYGVKLLGVDHIGIGSDFDGVSGALPEGLKSVADFPNLVASLQARGYGEGDIRKILGENLLRVWREVEKTASDIQRHRP
jgi:membrane dipeptidase